MSANAVPTPPYQGSGLKVADFDGNLRAFLQGAPPLACDAEEKPSQIDYLSDYLLRLGCSSVLVESMYMDRDYVDDVALYYSRNLRSYPNYCTRLHFFVKKLTLQDIHAQVLGATHDKSGIEALLNEAYLGFIVVRPLPAHPIGRTVLRAIATANEEAEDLFPCLRQYVVHLAGLSLKISGLAFQQQDQGVSACAGTAVWSASHRVAPLEDIRVPTSAEINLAATKYIVANGRSLPSQGLGVDHICEAIRAIGLAPTMKWAGDLKTDRPQILTYLKSGLPLVLALRKEGSEVGHAVCCVGARLSPAEHPSKTLFITDASSGLGAIYIHDDRIGPYVLAKLSETANGNTALLIEWPGDPVPEEHTVMAMVVPVPLKLRMSALQLRRGGQWIAAYLAKGHGRLKDQLLLDCRFVKATEYRCQVFGFGMTEQSLLELQTVVRLSRYIGVVALSVGGKPLIDILFDATEIKPNMAMIAIVGRQQLPTDLLTSILFLRDGFGCILLI